VTTNDALRRLRFALKLNDATMIDLLASVGTPVQKETLASYFLNDEDPGFGGCPASTLGALLDALIIAYRGKRDGGPMPQTPARIALDNNMILKKIRIALSLKEEDILTVMLLGGIAVSGNEISALFRDRSHRNYKECMDQFLRGFFTGLGKYVSTHPMTPLSAKPR
jgi:uncharacterized protein YehS (DUF1456 family)